MILYVDTLFGSNKDSTPHLKIIQKRFYSYGVLSISFSFFIKKDKEN